MASISKYTTKKGDFYRVQLYVGRDVDGKQIIKTVRGFKTKREAKKMADKLSVELAEGVLLENKSTVEFSEVYKDWFETYSLSLKESSINFIELLFKNHILPTLGNCPVQKITATQCQQMANEWARKEIVSIKKYALYTSKVFDVAISLNLIRDNPMKKIVIPKVKKRSNKKKFYTREELKMFMIAAKERCPFQFYVLIRVLAFTGARIGEVTALKWSDIDFENGLIKITKSASRGKHCRTYVSETKTESSVRDIYVDKKTLSLIKDWRIQQRKNLLERGFNANNSEQLVFSTDKNGVLAHPTPNLWIKKAAEQAGIETITAHGFRHTYATLAIQGGMNPKELQVQLGHSDIRTTLQIYTSVTTEQKMSIPEKFTSLVNF